MDASPVMLQTKGPSWWRIERFGDEVEECGVGVAAKGVVVVGASCAATRRLEGRQSDVVRGYGRQGEASDEDAGARSS